MTLDTFFGAIILFFFYKGKKLVKLYICKNHPKTFETYYIVIYVYSTK